MLIRCEKCATLYELDDNMLPSGGAPVQCSRCQHVFTAYPERRAQDGTGAPTAAGEEARRETAPPDAAAALASAAEAGLAAAESTPEPGISQAFGECPEFGENANGVTAEAQGPRELVSAPGLTDPASDGESAAGAAEARATAASTGGAAPQTGGPGTADGRSQARKASGGAAEDEPKFTADGRPIRKVPFPDDPASLSPRTATARPSLQAAPAPKGERARVPWLVPIVVAIILAFVAIVAWRLIATHSAGQDAGQQPAEGHSSLLRGGRPGSLQPGALAPAGGAAISARDGKARSDRVAGPAV